MSITHKWNGTVLTITSDSGTSSCDLKGEKGDTGVRGAQGVAGQNATITQEQITEALAAYFANNPLAVEVDKTLSIEGAAADALTVGNALGLANSYLDSINGEVI